MAYSEKDFLEMARPLAEGLLDYAKAAGKKYGITDAKIAISLNDDQDNSVEKGQVSQVISGTTCDIGITLFSGNRVLSFSNNSLNEDTLRQAMMKNMQVIHLVPENANRRLLDAAKVFKGSRADLDIYDKNTTDQSDIVTYAKKMEAAALACPHIKDSRSVSASKSSSHFLMLATNGIDFNQSSTMYQASASVVAEDKSGMQVASEYSMARHFSDLGNPEELGRKSGLEAAAKLNATLPATGVMPIVLDHNAAQSFFSTVYSAISGSAVYKESTFLKGKIGEQVMSKGITLVDDPAIMRGMRSARMDTAGLETKKITFIEDGVLQSYLYGLQESRQLGIEPIGRENGTTNSRILPGTQTPEELISDIKEGIYVKGFNGGKVDVNNGTHSRQAYGTLIKDGKITDIAVDGFVVSGNLKEMFMSVAIANDTPELPSTRYSLAAPTTRINGITIAGK